MIMQLASHTTRKVLVTVSAGLLLATGGVTSAWATESGRENYVRYGCYQCHGYEGQGAGFSGPRIAPNALPYETFAQILRRPYGEMPAYSTRVLTDAELESIYAFLESIPEPDRPTESAAN